jgi:hypothetical protein
MQRFYRVLSRVVLVTELLALLCALTKPAYGYVDPGSGLFAVQIISTTFAGALFMLRRRLKELARQLGERLHGNPREAQPK